MNAQTAPKYNYCIMNYLKERRLKANFEPVAFEEILQLLKDKKLHINDDTFSQWLKSKILSSNTRIGVSADKRYLFKPVYDIRNGKDLLQLLSDEYPGGVRLLDIESGLPNSKKILEKEVSKQIVYITGRNKEKIAFLSGKVQVKVDMKEFMIPWRDAIKADMNDTGIVEYLEKENLDPFLKEHTEGLDDLLSWIHQVPDILKELIRSTVRAFNSIEEVIVVDVLIQNPGINEPDIYNLLKTDEKQFRGYLDKLSRDKFVICRTERMLSGNKPQFVNSWYIDYKSFVNMLKYKLHKIKKWVQTTDNSVMTVGRFNLKLGPLHSLLKECDKVKILPPSYYHGLYRSVPVPDNEQKIQEYLDTKGIKIMQYEVIPSKKGRKAVKAKKPIAENDYSGDDVEPNASAVKNDENKLEKLAQLMGTTFLTYEDCRFLEILLEHKCLSEEDCSVLLSVTKREFVKKFKEMNRSHPFLKSGKYDSGAGAVEGKPKKINVCYIDYIVLVNSLQMKIHMMREKIPNEYEQLFGEKVNPMLALLDEIKDMAFTYLTVPKPANLASKEVTDFKGPSKQATSDDHGSDSEEEVGDTAARQSTSKRGNAKAEKAKGNHSASDEESKPTPEKRRKQTTSKNPTATGSKGASPRLD